MNFIDKIKSAPHYERLKHSAQYRFDRRQFLVMAAITVVYILFSILAATSGIKKDATNAIALIFSLVFLGVSLYFGYRWLEIFLYMDSYQFHRVRMDRLQTHGRGTVKFIVEFPDRQGKLITRQTDPMFSSEREPLVEKFNNKMAIIAYNEKTDRLIVIGLAQGNIH